IMNHNTTTCRHRRCHLLLLPILLLLIIDLSRTYSVSATEVLPIPASPSRSSVSPIVSPANVGRPRQIDDEASQIVWPNLEPTYPPEEHFDWDLVIVIPTHITEFSRRCAVRDSWARQLRGHEQGNKYGRRSVKLVFIVGAHAPDDRTRTMAEAEERQFGDIHVLPSEFVDEYRSLATKTRLSMRDAVHNIGKFRLLLKTDTDSYVHLERLLNFIEKEKMWDDRRVYAGAFRTDVVEWRAEEKGSKWWDGDFKKMTGLEHYPYNAKGAGYIVSYDLAKYLADPPIPLRRWTHEDVGVGSWLMAVDHRRVSMPVSFMTPECGCGATCDEDTFYQDEGDDILRRE
ncbi:Beta-1,3-galactosyltransferase, putative, partial [Perkinsus marinus ATCC 50983]